jgi:hypothetical protein
MPLDCTFSSSTQLKRLNTNKDTRHKTQDTTPLCFWTDRFLRVWPLDFRSYLLEAEYDAPATSAALAAGGLQLAVGSEDGVLGVLDLGSRRYAAAVRSHCGAVGAAAVHPTR